MLGRCQVAAMERGAGCPLLPRRMCCWDVCDAPSASQWVWTRPPWWQLPEGQAVWSWVSIMELLMSGLRLPVSGAFSFLSLVCKNQRQLLNGALLGLLSNFLLFRCMIVFQMVEVCSAVSSLVQPGCSLGLLGRCGFQAGQQSS